MQLEARFPERARPVFALLGTVVLLAFAGCHHAPGPDVVATVNGKEILRADLDKYYNASQTDNPQPPAPEQADMLRLNILGGMINDEIVQQRAAKLNLVASDEDVNAKITDMKTPYTQEEWDKQLKQRNITMDDLKRDVRKQITATKLVNKEIDSKINITDAEIGTYYNAHKAEFNLIEPRYGLSQILVSGNPPQQGAAQQQRKAPNEAEARKEIETLRGRLLNGEDFGTLAAQFTENPNLAQNGGNMGLVTETDLHRDIEVYNAIGALKPGQITASLPVYDPRDPGHKAVMGYQIYKLNSREPAGQRDLNDPRTHELIRETLRNGKAQLLNKAYQEMLHDHAAVRNFLAEQILKEGTP
ncbi:SurA N-terminal domain-containing protein [Terracidiphilus sp.]|uniref:SurA N-terminal domain-containing protein n=1 Tax=Terracidiphilus sp. TaxID=1964191 RepID=UPI003C2467EC